MKAAFRDSISKRTVFISLVALTVIISSGLVGCQKKLAPKTEVESRTHFTEFLLGSEDVLEVVVWRNQDLSRQVVVRPDGLISMPLIGDIQAAGLTPDQLAERITKRLREFKENPSVSVSVKEVNSYNVFVLGEVAKPGKYQLKSYTSILQAISMAGGFTPFAAKNKLQVVRHFTNGDGAWREVRLVMPYDDILKGRGDPDYFMIKAGDTIVVP
jgi:polysaccharide export outer membrane protein